MSKTIVSVSIFALLFVFSLFLFPLIGMAAQHVLPRWLSGALFFWPQLLLFPGGVETAHYYIGYGLLIYVAILFWCAAAYGFARVTNRFTTSLRALLVYPAIALTVIAIHTGLRLVGMQVMLEGP